MDTNNMQHLDMEDMLSHSLRNIFRSLSQEDVLINWCIFGGEQTVISLKFETPSQHCPKQRHRSIAGHKCSITGKIHPAVLIGLDKYLLPGKLGQHCTISILID